MSCRNVGSGEGPNQEKERKLELKVFEKGSRFSVLNTGLFFLKVRRLGIQWWEGAGATQLLNPSFHLHWMEVTPSCWQAPGLRLLIHRLSNNRTALAAPPQPPLETKSSLSLSKIPESLLRNTMDFQSKKIYRETSETVWGDYKEMWASFPRRRYRIFNSTHVIKGLWRVP